MMWFNILKVYSPIEELKDLLARLGLELSDSPEHLGVGKLKYQVEGEPFPELQIVVSKTKVEVPKIVFDEFGYDDIPKAKKALIERMSKLRRQILSVKTQKIELLERELKKWKIHLIHLGRNYRYIIHDGPVPFAGRNRNALTYKLSSPSMVYDALKEEMSETYQRWHKRKKKNPKKLDPEQIKWLEDWEKLTGEVPEV